MKKKQEFYLFKYGWRPKTQELIKKAYKNNFFTGRYELTKDGKKCLTLYLQGETYEKIGKEFNLSRQRIEQILRKLEKINKENMKIEGGE